LLPLILLPHLSRPMFVSFFIKRPVFSIVCALIILLLGMVSIPTLPIAQYPPISPPQVSVTSNYTSSSSNSGTSTINVTFDAKRNIDLAAIDVQNRISVAEPQLPDVVQRTGVTVNKQTSGFLMAIGLFTDQKEYDNIFLSNYADTYLVDALKRVKGVGGVRIFGERQYAMRVWLDPQRLAARQLTPQDVVTALNQQNLQVGAGRLGQSPVSPDQQYQIDLRAISRLKEPQEFENIVLRTEADGSLVKLKDVGRVELGAADYSSFLRFKGKDAVGLGITQLPGSNALDVAHAVRQELERLSTAFPPGMKYQVAFDTTLFVEASLEEVLITLGIAIVLVVLIIFIFLQDWRTTLIPSITIPTSLIGTFIFVKLFGFSINTLTLFGLTLATGMVVDDAIIVVEDISRLIQEKGMSPYRAAIAAMQELTGAVIATSLVLMAVFVPVAFFPGTTRLAWLGFPPV